MIPIDLITGTPTKVIIFIPSTYFQQLSFASLLLSPVCSKKEKRSHASFRFAWLLVLFKVLYLHFRYSAYLFIRMNVKRPRVVESIARKIYLIIGQSAVNTSPITKSQFCRTFCRASSLFSTTTSNTPLKTYCILTL